MKRNKYAVMSDLVGLLLVSGHYAKHTGLLILKCVDGIVVLFPEGDCCSHCYIQHISGSEALVGATILSVEDIESEPSDAELASKNYEVLDAWGHKITTNRGVCSIEMRTEHNGYYGGRLYVVMQPNDTTDAPALEDF